MGNRYNSFLKSAYWATVRIIVFKRDNYTCQKCGNCGKLVVHHNTYEHHLDELNNLIDLITWCEKCHNEFHQNKQIEKNALKIKSPKQERPPRSERKLIRRAIITKETPTKYYVILLCNNMQWVFFKESCTVSKRRKDKLNRIISTILFPRREWDYVQLARKQQLRDKKNPTTFADGSF